DRALVSVLGQLSREETPWYGGRLFSCPPSEVARSVLRWIVGAREDEPTRVRLESLRVIALDQFLERRDGPAQDGRRRLVTLSKPDRRGLLCVCWIRIGLQVPVWTSVWVGEAKSEHRRIIVAADLDRESMPPFAHRQRDAEPVTVEVTVFRVLENDRSVEED